jgi:apolipoprotein N-acyltransferase
VTAAARAAQGTPSPARVLALGLIVPALAGAACVLGFAPFYAWPVAIAALAILFWTWERSGSPLQAALSGYAFGLGYFLAGVSWVYVSLHQFGSMPALLAALATFLFCAFIALYPALAGWLAIRIAGDAQAARLVAAPAAFVLGEWLRGWVFTGFPWLTTGTSQVPGSPLAGYAPLVGIYGVSLAAAVAAALIAGLVRSFAWSRSRVVLALALAALFLVGGAARIVDWSQPAGAPITVALLQGNVPQELKWREEVRSRTLADYRQRIFDAKAKVVVLPETALPAFLDQLPPEYLENLRGHARAEGKEILMGTVERVYRGSDYDYYNSVRRITGGGDEVYRKRHLVPFGEFIPWGFKWVLAILHIPLSDFAAGAAGQAPVHAGGTSFAVAICYEDLFGEEVIDALPAAQVLLNVSNDAWFGESFAADQHLQASQARALESARWMLRATNTGATAAIDEKGRVVSRLPAFTAGTLLANVVPRQGATPYVRLGNAPAIVIALAMLGFAWRRARRGTPLR